MWQTAFPIQTFPTAAVVSEDVQCEEIIVIDKRIRSKVPNAEMHMRMMIIPTNSAAMQNGEN